MNAKRVKIGIDLAKLKEVAQGHLDGIVSRDTFNRYICEFLETATDDDYVSIAEWILCQEADKVQ